MSIDVSARPLWLQRTRSAVGIDWLEIAIAPLTEFGRRCRAGESLYRPGDEAAAQAAIARVSLAAKRLEPEALATLQRSVSSCPDPRSVLARACAGEALLDNDLFALVRFLDAVDEIRMQTRDAVFAEIGMPGPERALRALLAPGRTPSRTFYLSDAFDEELALARADASWRQVAYDAARSRLFDRVGMYAGIEQVRDGEFILMRDRIHGPLPPELRVLREAPTYLLCDVPLDEEALAALTALDATNRLVAELEKRVRALLSDGIKKSASTIEAEVEAIGALDSFLARVRFAKNYATCVPEIAAQPCLHFEDAYYLPLSTALAERKRAYQPISLQLDEVGVLSGSNMGGKTALLRTCAWIAACAALGVPVPARSARLSLFDEITWVGMNRELEGGLLLSAFGAEIVSVRGILERGATRTLILIDEFARMTSPPEERAFLLALTGYLHERGAVVLAATRLDGVVLDAGIARYTIVGSQRISSEGERPIDVESALERIGSSMDYRVVRLEQETPLSCDAVALADALGLERDIIARARTLL